MAKRLNFELPKQELETLFRISNIFKVLEAANQNEELRILKYYEIYESILTINRDVLGYAYSNIADSEKALLRGISSQSESENVDSAINE